METPRAILFRIAPSVDVARTGIDTAMKLGLNLPRGPFEILAARGTTIRATLAALEAAAPDHLKGRYLPALRVSA